MSRVVVYVELGGAAFSAADDGDGAVYFSRLLSRRQLLGLSTPNGVEQDLAPASICDATLHTCSPWPTSLSGEASLPGQTIAVYVTRSNAVSQDVLSAHYLVDDFAAQVGR
jgi:hypothetical protein